MPLLSRRLIICLILLPALNVYSQQGREMKIFLQGKLEADLQRSLRVKQFAATHNLPISLTTLEGKHMLMVDVENGMPVYKAGLNAEAAVTTGAALLHSGTNGIRLEGEGMLIGVWDDGSVAHHADLDPRVVSRENEDFQNHATHVTGTLISSGLNSSAKGMAPKASVTNWYFDNDIAEMTALAKPDQTSLLLSNHSYGTVTGWTKVNGEWQWAGNPSVSPDEDYRFGFYGPQAAELDELANLAPYYTIVWAAGNDRGEPGDGSRPPDCNGGLGYDCIIPESVAKNIITVGAVNKVASYSGAGSVVMSSFSSWGPTDDGRIKPDLVGAGVNLFSTSSIGIDSYGFLSGTSMATPNVTGSLTLLQELYKRLNGGKVMKSSSLKALAIHTAKEAGALPGPDYQFGWGLLDVDAAAGLLTRVDGIATAILEEVLNDGDEFELFIFPKANQKITATIAWNDPVATVAPVSLDPIQLALVNDLDVRLVSESGNVNYPWVLDPANAAGQATRGDNFRDNVEKLEFGFPEAVPHRLIISHKNKLAGGSQPFSLVLTYQSTQSGQTFYWIGDSGNWSDPSHWSLSSGGTSASMVPGANDAVIVDENSFDGSGIGEITIDANQSCASLKWLDTKTSGLLFKGNILTISRELLIANSNFSIEDQGSFHFDGENGSVQLNSIILPDVDFVFNSGAWKTEGELQARSLSLNKGTLNIVNGNFNLNQMTSASAFARQMSWDHSQIKVSSGSTVSGNNLDWSVNESLLLIENSSDVVLDWTNASFGGKLVVNESSLVINGDNSVDELELRHSLLGLGGGSNFSVGRITILESTEENPVSISSAAGSELTFADHFLLCTDFMRVENVNLKGTAKINVGPNGVLTNSANWVSQDCASVLFADFSTEFLCQDGFTEFSNASLGPATSWSWDFGDEASEVNSSTEENPFHSYNDGGTYEVHFTVTDGVNSHSVNKQIEILPSSQTKNQIVIGPDLLTSLDIASTYQWFLDEKKIENAIERSYNYDGASGLYRVVTYDEACNHASDPVLITGVENSIGLVSVFPNPANDFVNISTIEQNYLLTITDAVGRICLSRQQNGSTSVSTRGLNNGLYFLKISAHGESRTYKLLISR